MPDLLDLAALHHRHVVGDVRDEEIGDAESALQFAQQVEGIPTSLDVANLIARPLVANGLRRKL